MCNPSAIRPSQFVPEPLHGYLMLAERLAVDPAPFASAWNFGPPMRMPCRCTALPTNELDAGGTAPGGLVAAPFTHMRRIF
jgi:hypothetical protein